MIHLISTALGLILGTFIYQALTQRDWSNAAGTAYCQAVGLATYGFNAWLFGWPL